MCPIEVTVEIPEPEVEVEAEPVVVIVPEPVDTSELDSLREFKAGVEAERVALAQATADEALATAQAALEVALIVPEAEPEEVEILEVEPIADIAPEPDTEPNNSHPFFKNW